MTNQPEYVKRTATRVERRTPNSEQHAATLRANGWNPACPIRFGWAVTKATAAGVILVDCILDQAHDGPHTGTWDHGFAGTKGHTDLTWQTSDRRAFAGDWHRCEKHTISDRGHPARCLLPANHPRECAA